MLNRQINARQAGESAAPAQNFATPQDEIRHIRVTDRTLNGFARILEIVRAAGFFQVDQSNGMLADDWLTNHSTTCGACVGALLSWFFGGPTGLMSIANQGPDDRLVPVHGYDYNDGRKLFAQHLGMGIPQMQEAVLRSLRRTAGGRLRSDIAEHMEAVHNGPFCKLPWPADYAEVFRDLAGRFPGK